MAKVNLPVVYSQFDDRWAKLLLGFNTDQRFNFYNYACLITCLANICRYFGFDETPATVNQKLKDLGVGAGFTNGGLYVWGALMKIHPEIKEKLVNIGDVPVNNTEMAEIRNALDAGIPVMFQLDVNPKTVENDTHYVIAVDYNPNDENDFLIADPLGGRLHSLKDYLGWFRPSARNSIFQYAIYTGKKKEDDVDIMRREWPNVVHGSTEWDKTVAEYRPGDDPKKTQFEDVRTVINGFKGRATDLDNQLKEANKVISVKEQEIQNRIDQVANVKAECQKSLDIEIARYTALTKTMPDVTKLDAQYRGTITQLQNELREAQKQNGLLKNQIAEIKSGVKKAVPAIQKLTDILKGLFT